MTAWLPFLRRRPHGATRRALIVGLWVLAGCVGGPPPSSVPSTGDGQPLGSPVMSIGPGLASVSPAATNPVAAPSGTAAATGRPSSPAVVAIVSPTNDAVVTGSSVHVVISLQNAQIVQATTTAIDPSHGHIHLYVDGVLVSMNYSLEQDLPVTPGTYQLKAEFVAADHAPFNPRVWSDVVLFTVH